MKKVKMLFQRLRPTPIKEPLFTEKDGLSILEKACYASDEYNKKVKKKRLLEIASAVYK